MAAFSPEMERQRGGTPVRFASKNGIEQFVFQDFPFVTLFSSLYGAFFSVKFTTSEAPQFPFRLYARRSAGFEVRQRIHPLIPPALHMPGIICFGSLTHRSANQQASGLGNPSFRSGCFVSLLWVHHCVSCQPGCPVLGSFVPSQARVFSAKGRLSATLDVYWSGGGRR